jgi:predicted dehydrogenase
MKTIRWGIIGCGDVTEVKSGPGFAKAANSTLVAVMRRDGALAADYARRHGVPRSTDDADAIIRADDIDAVYVATPPSTHREYVERCAAAGKPVLVEKPMAMDAAECQAMIASCRDAHVPLWVAYYRRALPRFLAVRDLVRDGAIGEVRMVTTRHFVRASLTPAQAWRVDTATSGGGLFLDVATHTLDFLDFLFGPIEAVRGFAGNLGGAYAPEDTLTASYRFASGVYGNGAWCFTAGCDDESNEIVGSRGRIVFSTTRPVPIRLARGADVEEIAAADPPHVHQPLIQAIVDELNGGAPSPSTGETALRTTAVADAILREYRGRTA